MATFANGARALAICDVCGFQYRLSQLRKLVVNTNITNIKACPSCYDRDHPQLQLGRYPVEDPQALEDPRPDNSMAESRVFQWGWAPVGGGQGFGDMTPNALLAHGEVGDVTVTT